MKRLLTVLRWLAIAAACLVVLALVSVNLFLRSDGVRARIEEGLHRRLGTPVTFDSLSYLPWRGLKVTRLTIPHRDAADALTSSPFLEAKALIVRVPLTSVWERPIRIEEVLCIEPTITSIPLEKGGIALPWQSQKEPPVQSSSPKQPRPKESAQESPKEAEEPAPETNQPKVPSPSSPRPAIILLELLRLQHGNVVVLDPAGKRALIRLSGIQSHLDLAKHRQSGNSDEVPVGKLTVDKVSLLDYVRARDVRGDLNLRQGLIQVTDLKAEAEGGEMKGQALLQPQAPGMPFQAEMVLRDVQVPPVASRVSPRLVFSRGKLAAKVLVQGVLKNPNSWRGGGMAELTDAAMERHGLLESLGRYLGVQEFVEVAFETAETEFVLKGPVLHFQDIHLKTHNLELKALGAVGLNQRLRIPTRLYFSERMKEVLRRIERQLPERVTRKFQQVEGRDDYYRDFLITGTVSEPRADFIGSEARTFEQMIDLLRSVRESMEEARP